MFIARADQKIGPASRRFRRFGASGSQDVTPLILKLQQVLFRGPSRDLSPSPSSNSISPLNLSLNPIPPPENLSAALSPSPVAAATSSPESGDDSWGFVEQRAPVRRALGEQEDAVLHYIDEVLMEDRIEQEACLDMEIGVGAIQAELAELIQTSSPPAVNASFEVSTSSPQHNQQQHQHQYHPHQGSSSSSPSSPSPSSLNNSDNSSFHKSQKKRGLPTEQEKAFQMISSRVSVLEVFSRNGILSFPNRPPRLLGHSSTMLARLREMGLEGLDEYLLTRLFQCGEAVSIGDLSTANGLISDLRSHGATPEGNAIQRLVSYFIEALDARMYNTGEEMFNLKCKNRPSVDENLKAVQMIVKFTPFLGLPHLFTNRIILDSIKGAKKIHIVDFGIMYGLQWPALFQMLSQRKEGVPDVRITGIDLPPLVNNHNDRIQETGSRIRKCANDWGIPFKFKGLCTIKWESVDPSTLQLKDDEALIISCSFKQTNLFDDTVIAESPKNQWLVKIRQLNPRVVIQCLASSDFGEFMFLRRFQEAVIHHAAIFEAMAACISRMEPQRVVIEKHKYGREIMNIVACERLSRVERSESHSKWSTRAVKAGLEIIPLNPALIEESKQFAGRYHQDLTVARDGEWLWLGWRNQIIHAYSAWKPAS